MGNICTQKIANEALKSTCQSTDATGSGAEDRQDSCVGQLQPSAAALARWLASWHTLSTHTGSRRSMPPCPHLFMPPTMTIQVNASRPNAPAGPGAPPLTVLPPNRHSVPNRRWCLLVPNALLLSPVALKPPTGYHPPGRLQERLHGHVLALQARHERQRVGARLAAQRGQVPGAWSLWETGRLCGARAVRTRAGWPGGACMTRAVVPCDCVISMHQPG